MPQVTNGPDNSCILNDGLASCWGKNYGGQIGNGTTNPSAVPVPVNQGAIRYASIGAGSAHTCALSTSGEAYCWGVGANGRVGNGSLADQTSPTPVSQGALRFTSLAVGSDHTCALTADGQGYCWGSNSGRLGNGGSTNATSPSPVSQGGLVFTKLVNGDENSCALTSEGNAYCWGINGSGQIGDGTTTTALSPIAVSQSSLTFTEIKVGLAHTCALTGGGKTYCWGAGANGRLGTGSSTNQSTPAAVSQSSLVFASISVRSEGGCGLTNDSKLFCWGANKYGSVGDGTTTDRNVPVQIGAATWLALSSSAVKPESVCAVDQTKAVLCWGLRIGGLGNNTMPVTQSKPVAVQGGLTFTSISTGAQFSCGLVASGQAYCWGWNLSRQFGNNTRNSSMTPTPVSQGGYTYVAISTGDSTACGLTAAGQAYCWGVGTYGQMGNGTTSSYLTPTAVTQGGTVYSSIKVGAQHTCALTSGGQTYCWGTNSNGRLGNGNTTTQLSPVAVSQSSISYASIVMGYASTCGLTSAGQTYCWGLGTLGRLGNGSLSSSSTPVAVTQGGITYSSVAAYGDGACGLTAAGQAYCWGYNEFGQVGDGTVTSRTVPVAVTQAGVTFTSINGQQLSVCGVTSSGSSYCWGSNVNGALGNGSSVNQLTPAAVSTTEQFSTFARGLLSDFTCALNTSGKAFCWGLDTYGQLGAFAGTNALVPEEVSYYVRVNGVTLDLAVLPLLSLTVDAASSCNGVSNTAGVLTSGSTVSFGNLSPVVPSFGAQELSVQTNAGQGFDLLLKSSGSFTGSSGTIANVTGTNGAPAAFGTGARFGYTSSLARFSGPLWAQVETTSQLVGFSAVPVALTSQCVGYQVAASSVTPAGAYGTTITYIVVPKF